MITFTHKITYPDLPPLLLKNRETLILRNHAPPPAQTAARDSEDTNHPLGHTSCSDQVQCRPGPSYSSRLSFIWDRRPWAGSLSQGSRHNKILNMVSQYHSTRCPRGSGKEAWVPKSIPQARDKSPPQHLFPHPREGHPNERLLTQTFSGQEDRPRRSL